MLFELVFWGCVNVPTTLVPTIEYSQSLKDCHGEDAGALRGSQVSPQGSQTRVTNCTDNYVHFILGYYAVCFCPGFTVAL